MRRKGREKREGKEEGMGEEERGGEGEEPDDREKRRNHQHWQLVNNVFQCACFGK